MLPKHIVIVEDEVITQRYLRDILSQYDVEVTACFSNASDTMEKLPNIATSPASIKLSKVIVDILIKHRIVYLGSTIDSSVANLIISQLKKHTYWQRLYLYG